MNRKKIAAEIREALKKGDMAATYLINERLSRSLPPLDPIVVEYLRETAKKLANIANQIVIESPHIKN